MVIDLNKILQFNVVQLSLRVNRNTSLDKALRTLLYLSHDIVILVHGIELEMGVGSNNHITVSATESLFSLIT